MASSNPLKYTAMEMMKGIVGAVLAGLTAAVTALPDGVTSTEWLTIVGAAAVTFGAVFGVPNASSPDDPTPEGE